MKEYKHTQIGYLLIVALGVATLLISTLSVITRFNPGAILLLIFMILCLALFATLTVQVNNQAVNIQFGIGVIRKRFALQNVQAIRVVKNPWYYGWGIHLTPEGWLFNVSGSEAVELQMKDGRKYRIGTDEARGLMEAVDASLKSTRS
jgi:hypothetical protein